MFYGVRIIYMYKILSIISMAIVLIAKTSVAQTSMKYQKAQSLDFYDQQVYQSIIIRLENINTNAERKWGKMEVAQMLHHLNLAIGSGLGYYHLPNTSNVISRTFNKWMILSVLKRFPRQTQTASSLIVASSFDFDTEKKQLLEILKKAFETKTDAAWAKHTYFGQLSRKEWGKLIVIHCNHHFQQFSN